ncbi:hypothetical protein FQN54_004385 [Arachnomyces sp. PD_36]|nr:hypothetical protein FQN54_004385 [Arachnomyces sp. PD_36]
MTDAEWEPFKLVIKRLYENKTLDEVMEEMTSKYAFDKNKGQYQRRLKKWGFTKNQKLSPAEWESIGLKTGKRKLHEQKESEVYINGVQINPERFKKAKHREAFIPTHALYSNAPSPGTPEGVIVCTPTTSGMDLSWSPSLPWFRFSRLLQLGTGPDAPSPSSSFAIPSPKELYVARTANQALMQRLVSIVPWNKLNQPPNIHSSSRTETALSILMPEEFDGQHLALSSSLRDSKQMNRDCLSIELFLLSNNLISHEPSGRSEDSMRLHDQRVMKMFNESGWNDVKHLQLLISSHEPTAAAIAEKLFASSLRLFDLKTVGRMLEAKMNPDTAVETVRDGILTPLQFAIVPLRFGAKIDWDRRMELLQLLFSYGANVNFSYGEYPTLYYAIQARNGNAIRLLLAHGAIVTSSCLYSAASSRIDDHLSMKLIDACSDVNERTQWWGNRAIVQTVIYNRVKITRFLLAKGADANELGTTFSDKPFITTTTLLGFAARHRSLEMIQLLLEACENVNPDFDGKPYESPLVLALEGGWNNYGGSKVQVIKTLLDAGVSLRIADDKDDKYGMTLIERAVAAKDKDLALCQLLLKYGAQVDMPLTETKRISSAILAAIQGKAFDIVDALIDAGARLNDRYSKSPGTVLGAAIELGDQSLISKLLSAGATVVDEEKIRRIGCLSTAVYLWDFPVFKSILRGSGQRILATALLAKDKHLAQFLLEQGADLNRGLGKPRACTSEKTPLGAAIRTHNFAFVETLLNRGAMATDYNLVDALAVGSECLKNLLRGFNGSAPTAVGAAIFGGKENSLGILRDAGVDPTGVPQNQDNWDPGHDFDFSLEPPTSVLEIAVVYGDKEDLELLLQWARWDRKLTGRALTTAILIEHDEIADELLEYGADVQQDIWVECFMYNEEDDDVEYWGETFSPLQAAAKQQLGSVAQKLVQSVDVNYLGEGARRRTPLQHAVENGDMDLINLLLENGARVDGPPAELGGATALQIAAIQGYIGIARKLIDLGASVNEPPARYQGRTALQGAAEHGRIDMLHMLLEEGALVVGDGERHYQKAVELGERNGHNAAVRMLRSFRDSVQLATPEAI